MKTYEATHYDEPSLERPEPDYDPCYMNVGGWGLCMLPGTHRDGCLPMPVGYPPLVTVAVGR